MNNTTIVQSTNIYILKRYRDGNSDLETFKVTWRFKQVSNAIAQCWMNSVLGQNHPCNALLSKIKSHEW